MRWDACLADVLHSFPIPNFSILQKRIFGVIFYEHFYFKGIIFKRIFQLTYFVAVVVAAVVVVGRLWAI